MDINKASAEDLERAFQIDGTRARYLIEHRNKSGAFKSWDDVKQIEGFDEKLVEDLRAAGITIGSSREPGEHHRSMPSKSNGDHEPRSGASRLDINSASEEELQRVFQMDGQRARYLVETRQRLGQFHSWDELKREAPSFDDGMVENLKKAGATISSRRE